MARLVNPKTGSVIVVPDEKVERLQVLYGLTVEGSAPAKKAAPKKAAAKKAPAKKAASGESEK